MTIEKSPFGVSPEGQSIERLEVRNANGLSFAAIAYGATLVSVQVPDGRGNSVEATLGFDSAEEYLSPHPGFGVTVGRVANRIAGGSFQIGKKRFNLPRNEAGNTLHGGPKGFSRRFWTAELFGENGGAGVRFSRTSKHGEEGFPGTLEVTATYTLTVENELVFDYEAMTDRTTPVNLTNHAYWNLMGSGTILDHELTVHAEYYLPIDEESIPTGELAPVAGTAFDFRKPRRVGADIARVPGGYDHCYIVHTDASGTDRVPPLRHVARLVDPTTGRGMDVLSTQNGVQLYTGNKLEGKHGRRGKLRRHSALCLETQGFPDAVNQPDFPSVLLEPGQVYRQRTVHRFFVR